MTNNTAQIIATEPKTIGRFDYRTLQTVPLATIQFRDDVFAAYMLADGRVATPCWKCSTEPQPGSLRHFDGIYDGVCFACRGRGFTSTAPSLDDYAKRQRANARARDRRAAKKEAEREARAAEFAAREAERLAAEAAEAAERDARLAEIAYLGEIGEKVTFTGTVRAAMTVDGYAYGTTQRFLVVVGDGFVAKAYTSAAWAYDVERGETVTIAATVKRHDERDGERVTLVKSPKRAA